MSTVTGTVFWDNNYDGAYNGGDTTIEGSRIDLYVWNNTLNDWTYTSTIYNNEYEYYYFEVATM